MALADVYDALINKRVYKPMIPHVKAADIIVQGSGAHFDPDIAGAFAEISATFLEIALANCDSDEDRQALLAGST